MTDNRPSRVNRYLVVAYFIEVGLILLVVPWSGFWERNYFTQGVPVLEWMLGSPIVRGAVSGLGVVNLITGISDFVALLAPRRVH